MPGADTAASGEGSTRNLAKRYRFGSQIQAIIKTTKRKKKWYEVDCDQCMNAMTGYIAFAFGSFALMIIFGVLSIRVSSVCEIQNAEGRCCSCVTMDNPEVQLEGQSMPYVTSYNDIFYGVLMIVNSLFGIMYLYTGLHDENKYILFCMVATQSLECARGLLDVAQEAPSDESPTMRLTREILMFAAAGVMAVGWVFLRSVHKMFGWKIFRQGGAKKAIRNMYKTFQRYRAANLLDIQSSFLLFLIFFLYLDVVRWHGYWVFICFFLCDIQASRYMVKYLKHEDLRGVILSVVCKLFVISWWGIVIFVYVECYNRYSESRAETAPWWTWGLVPSLSSVVASYDGLSCLAPNTVHDARTYEMVMLNFGQAVLFRVASIVISVFVCKDFGKGLRDVFYVRQKSDRTESLISQNEMRSVNAEEADDKKYGEFSDEEWDPNKEDDGEEEGSEGGANSRQYEDD